MAILQSAVFDQGKGAVGNMILSDYVDGKVIARSKPLSVANPNTVGQQKQRGKFGIVQSLGSLILLVINSAFAAIKNTHSPYNSFMSINLGNLAGWDDTSTTDPVTLLQMTNGNLSTDNITVSPTDSSIGTPGTLSVEMEWDDSSDNQAVDQSDKLKALVIDKVGKKFKTVDTGITRVDQIFAGDISYFPGNVNYVSFFFQSVTTGEVSSAGVHATISASDVLAIL